MLEHRKVEIEIYIKSRKLLNDLKFDSRRLKQVLNNLLSNAIKFTKKGTI